MIRASAPGSVMITGEHAVVYDNRAIVAAIEQRLTVTLQPRSDRVIRISSEIAPPQTLKLDGFEVAGPYKFLLAAIDMHRDQLKTGFDLSISSEIDPTLGLGSSAAVTIAGLGAILAHMGGSRTNLHAKAHKIINDIQGRGSGADLAASLKGGVLSYRAPPQTEMIALPSPPPLSLRYCGYKTPTSEVLQKIADQMRGHEGEYDTLYAEMGSLAETAIFAAQSQDWPTFAAALTNYQTRMERLGVSDDTLRRIIETARSIDGVMAAKISGSGLGDCVLAIGAAPLGFVPVKLATEGLILHD